MARPSFVYVIGPEDGPYKIGTTIDPKKRLQMLQAGCPYKVYLLYVYEVKDSRDGYEVEWWTHKILDQHRLHGEWFDADIFDVIMAIKHTQEDRDALRASWTYPRIKTRADAIASEQAHKARAKAQAEYRKRNEESVRRKNAAHMAEQRRQQALAREAMGEPPPKRGRRRKEIVTA